MQEQHPHACMHITCIYCTVACLGVFMLGDITYPNNTVVLIEDIGEADMNSLKCTTAYDPCCRSSRQGNFYYPNKVPVLIQSQASSSRQSLYRTRGSGSVSLKQQSGDPPPLGRYHCEIPNGRGILQSLYIKIGEICHYS